VKICLFGNFGTTNPGNEATLLAVVSRLRRFFPEAELCCICASPANLDVALGIDAVPFTNRSLRIWNRDAPFRRRVLLALPAVCEEAWEYVGAWKMLKGTKLLIVPGTGLLTDAWGLSAWGPYGLLKWLLIARLRGSRVIFVSVGAGPVHTRLGRLFLRCALSLAHYRSYRDLPSKKVVEDLGLRATEDRIYPDLVFDLSVTSIERPDDGRRGPVVGVGLMEYAAKYSVPGRGADTYMRYLESLAFFVGWLLDREYEVKLLLGDADTVVIEDFRDVLREQLGPRREKQLADPQIGSVEELFSQLEATDVVVATRFHNVLMSLMLGKPAIAISFHHKVSALMNEMGLPEYCHDINRMNTEVLIAQFEALVRDAEELKRTIAQRVEEFRRALDEQYEFLFAAPVDQPAIDEVVTAS